MMDLIQLNIWAILYIVIAIQGFIITGILLTTRKGQPQANRYLAVLIFSFSCTRLQSFVTISGLVEYFPHFMFAATPFWYILAPFYFLYIRAMLGKPIRLNWQTLLHFVPFLTVLLYLIPFYLLPAETKILFWTQSFQPEFGLQRFLFVVIYDLQNLPYLVASIVAVRKPEISGRANNVTGAHVFWLKFLLKFIAFYMFLDFIVALVRFMTGDILLEMQYLPMLIFSILIYAISYLAFAKPETIFPRSFRFGNRTAAISKGRETRRQLLSLMEEQKVYRNSELRYSDVASQLGISVSQLSRLLNQEIGQSFNNFVNTYRVKDAIQKLSCEENSNFTLLAVAYESGFNSKASFNRIFKKHTGVTPSQYLKLGKHNSLG